MSDKTREQVRKDFEAKILKSVKCVNLERDALFDYISPFTLASWQSWQAAHEMYAPKWRLIANDDIPREGQPCIVFANGVVQEAIFTWWLDDDGRGEWENDDERFHSNGTHMWMPLPKQEQAE